MSTPEQADHPPLISLTIDRAGDGELDIRMSSHGLTLHQTRELLREAMLNLDQEIWRREQGANIVNLPASAF